MSVCQFPSIQVSCRGVNKSVTNVNHLTTVADIIDALLDDLSEKPYLTINDYCLYVEQHPYLLALNSTDFIHDLILRYPSSNILRFQLAFKRTSSPSRFAQQQNFLPIPFEQLRIQELVIQKQQEIINQLTRTNDYQRTRHLHSEETNPTLSRVRFRLSTRTRKYEVPTSTIGEVKSILKKSAVPRSSSVDRDIDQLVLLQPGENSFCTTDDDNLSEQSTTDSCLGSLSSNDSVAVETLV